MVRRRRRRKKRSEKRSGKVEINYPEDLVMAVKYLIEKGFNSREVAERLDISPYTVRSIKYVLRKRGLLETEEEREKVARKTAVVKAKSKNVLSKILGGE